LETGYLRYLKTEISDFHLASNFIKINLLGKITDLARNLEAKEPMWSTISKTKLHNPESEGSSGDIDLDHLNASRYI